MSSRHKRRLRGAHEKLGLFLAAGALLMILTGLALQHPGWLGRGALPPRVVTADPAAPGRLLRASPALLEESLDGGATWNELPLSAAPDAPVAAAFAPPPARGAWLLGATELLASADGGAVWERLELPPGVGSGDPPLALTVTADGRPVVVAAHSAWLGGPLGEGGGARWTSLWRVEPTRGDRLRLAVRRLHTGHWGPPLTPRLYDLAALLFVAVLATGVARAARARRRHRQGPHR
ncbi:hypothetical protein FJ250_04840 [bacterium]|nr:hypothetical protein [bacterium]